MDDTDVKTPPPPPMAEPQLPPLAQQPLPALTSPPPAQVMQYATQAPSNQAAVLSLVFGLLFYVPLALPGILAIVFGRRGLKAGEEQAAGRVRMAQAGIVLGVINLVLSVALAAFLPFGYAKARRQAQTVQCAANLRQIGLAAMIYVNQNRGFLPPTVDHLAAMNPGAAGVRIMICPACGTDPAKPPVLVGKTVSSHYHYIPAAPRLMQIRQQSRSVLAYEPPTNHDNRTMNVLFCDGHVEVITGPSLPKIAAELAAGQNPPPSMK